MAVSCQQGNTRHDKEYAGLSIQLTKTSYIKHVQIRCISGDRHLLQAKHVTSKNVHTTGVVCRYLFNAREGRLREVSFLTLLGKYFDFRAPQCIICPLCNCIAFFSYPRKTAFLPCLIMTYQ